MMSLPPLGANVGALRVRGHGRRNDRQQRECRASCKRLQHLRGTIAHIRGTAEIFRVHAFSRH
jgi:hypothetical protein